MILHKLYVYLILVFKLLGKHRFQSILFLYLNVRRQGSSHTLNVWKRRKDRNGISFPLIERPLPLHLWPNLFFLAHSFFRPFRFSSLTSPYFFPLQKTTPLDTLYSLYPYIALISWQFLFHCSFIVPFPKPTPHILLCPSHLSQSMTCLCPFSILFPDPFACHLTSFRHLPYCYFRRIFLFVLSDTRTVSISLCPLFYSYLIERGLADRIIQ